MDQSIINFQVQAAMLQLLMKWMEASQRNSDESAVPPEAESTEKLTGSFSDLIQRTSEKYNVDPKLVQAVVTAESNFNPDAVSHAGAQGLMQLMPATATGLGVENPFDPTQNVDGGVRLLRQLLDRYDGNTSLALAAYNAGPGAVSKYGGIPPYQETQTYVKRVLELWQ